MLRKLRIEKHLNKRTDQNRIAENYNANECGGQLDTMKDESDTKPQYSSERMTSLHAHFEKRVYWDKKDEDQKECHNLEKTYRAIVDDRLAFTGDDRL